MEMFFVTRKSERLGVCNGYIRQQIWVVKRDFLMMDEVHFSCV